ncbi:hypothetical protein SLW70_02210 [Flavobacterium sp. NG2]|uniref:hypothetical protein n=1 Tax=Flavobacterium sp. NG2 TaxID=3097547 RepID=UPI002A812F50|nr:hypothetical protein [Flavobacterium sp. NG2]WPR71966.1 hypothetical protein SLW70_02210 [Flavobacterium sp. NG2]
MKKLFLPLMMACAFFQSCSTNEIDNAVDSESAVDHNLTAKISDFKGTTSTVLTGYNLRWLDTPDFSTSNIVPLIESLKPKIFRYPGGTVAHKWNWRTGRTSDGGSASNVTHLIGDVKTLADATGAKVTFVLDVVHSSVEDQIEMMQAANVPVEYIELGNELYATEYEVEFPTGKEYADTINSWVPKLRTEFPNAKIGAVMIGRLGGPNNTRANEWNTKVHQNITQSVDAYIYHVYMNNSEGTTARLQRLDDVFILNSNKETWVTEYGDKNQDYNEAIKLADLLTGAPYNTKLLLNHCVYAKSGDFTKFVDTGNGTTFTYTPEGYAFLTTFNPNFAKLGHVETFEDHTTDVSPLASAGMKSFALSGQTIASNQVLSFQNKAGFFADENNVSASSDNGVNVYYVATGTQQMDNVLISPKYLHDGTGTVTMKIDASYAQRAQNNAIVTFYYSTTHDGSATFNPSQWTVIGTETAANMYAQGLNNNMYKRESFNINPSANFHVAVRIQQTFDATYTKTQWRFDNLNVFK